MKVFAEIFAKFSFLAAYVILVYVFLVDTSEERKEKFYNDISDFIESNSSNITKKESLIFKNDEEFKFEIIKEKNLIKVTSDYFRQPETLFNSYKNKAQEMCIYMNERKNKEFDIKKCDDYIEKDYFYI